MTALPPLLGVAGAFAMVIGGGYEALAQTNPDVPALLGWPTGLAGLLTQAGAFMVGLRNQKVAESEPPIGVLDEQGKPVDQTVYFVSLAVAKALKDGNHELVRDLANAMEKQNGNGGAS